MRKNEANADIRKEATRQGIFLWQLARRAGVAPTTLNMWLREPLADDDPRRVLLMQVLEGGDNGKTKAQQ